MQWLEFLKAFFFGIIEGVTEWLPISSTGHMLILDEFMRLEASEAFRGVFFVVIQLGAIFAVLLRFFSKLNFLSPKKSETQKKTIRQIWLKIIVASLPAAIIGFFFEDRVDAMMEKLFVVAAALLVYGVLIIWCEKHVASRRLGPQIKSVEQLDMRTALIIGMVQVLAMIPGTSRSGVTIPAALLLGVSRTAAAEFSFYLSIPVMFGASFLRLIKSGFGFTGMEWGLLATGMVTAFIVSVFIIDFLMRYIRRHDFKVFGWYRIGLGALLLIYLLFIAP